MPGSSTLVGLTGGIGTGKSRVADLLGELGASVICADRIVHELQAPGGAGLAAIRREFGDDYLTASGELDRAKLGERVFSDPDARARLSGAMAELIVSELRARTLGRVDAGDPVVVADIPLLFEGRGQGRGPAMLPFDVIAVVYAREEQQIERVMARDGLDRDAAHARVRAQIPIEDKRAEPGVIVIDNSGDGAATDAMVRELYRDWSKRA